MLPSWISILASTVFLAFLSTRARAWSLSFYFCRPHHFLRKKGAFTGFYRINFFGRGGLLFFSAATNFAAVILNVNTERGGKRVTRTAYGYRDRLRIEKNSNISRDNISFDPIENCKCFHRIKSSSILVYRNIFIPRVHSLSFLIDIVKSNAIFIFVHRCRFCLPEHGRGAARRYNYGLVKF